MMPAEAMEALVIEAICQRYGCLPSQARAEDVRVLRHMQLVDLARPREEA